jgi:DNA-binding IclR family transcriptional regulator
MGQSVAQRLLAILAVFDNQHTSWTLTALSHQLDMPLSTTHRLVNELVQWGALQRDERGRFYVGARLWEIGSLYSGLDAVRNTAMPYLGDLLATTGHNVHLAALDGNDVVFLAQLTSGRAVATRTQIGGRLPAAITATGRVLLAHSPTETIDAVLASGIPPYCRTTTTDVPTLRTVLHQIRSAGYTIATGEVTEDAVAVASPIRNRWGIVCAAVALVADSQTRSDTLVPLLLTHTHAISRALGFNGTQTGKTR